jgi:energy-coupling factor transporter ATP-binding protein EcfA2
MPDRPPAVPGRPPLNAPRRRQVTEVDIDREAPRISWDELYGHLEDEFEQGDHVAIIGPTGTGKTHLAFEIAELRSYVMVVACKPKDPLISEAQAKGYYLIPSNKLEVPYADGRPIHPRVIYWPRLSEREAKTASEQSSFMTREKAHQKPRVRHAIGYVRLNGSWALLLDEGTWVCRDLGLQRDVDSALFQFRTLDASVIILGQRPSWMGRYVLAMPTHLFIFQTSDLADSKSLGEISGVNSETVRAIVPRLDFHAHEFLYLNTRRRMMFRSVAPPR